MDLDQMRRLYMRCITDFPFDIYYEFGVRTQPKIIQFGGEKTYTDRFIDEGGIYTYKISIDESDDEQVMIYILSTTKMNCVIIAINLIEHVAILENLSYYDNCAREGLMKPGGGTKLLRFTLNLLLKLQSTYKFNKILLKDNSFLYCPDSFETISLANLKMITDGRTWYMKYGFKPYNPGTQKHSDEIDEAIQDNINILKNLKTDAFDILGIVDKVIRVENKTNIEMGEIKRLTQRYPIFKEFIKRLIIDSDKYCCILIPIMNFAFAPKNRILNNIRGQTFYLNI